MKKYLPILTLSFFLVPALGLAGQGAAPGSAGPKKVPKAPAKKSPASSRPAPHATDAMESLAAQVALNLKNAGAKNVAVLEFAYSASGPSSGPAVIQKALIASLNGKGPFTLFEKSRVDSAASGLNLSPDSSNPASALKIAQALGADAVISGTMKDVKGKNKVEVQLMVRETKSAKIIALGSQTLVKTWSDPVPGCGPMQFTKLSTAAFSPQGSPGGITLTFAPPWWPVQTLGRILWNFCGPAGRPPALNDALPDLRKKAWDAGGRHLVVEKSDLDPANPKVLKIEARVVH